jgi:hypothetical protein
MTTSTSEPIPGTSSVTIRYSLGRTDLWRLQMYGLSRHRVVLGFLLVAGTLAACFLVREPDIAPRSLAFKIAFTVLFDVLFLCCVFVMQAVLSALTILLGKHRGLLGEHFLEVRDDGLLERTDFNESLHRWAGFHKVRATRSSLYLYVTETLVHMVPLRYFASPADAEAFRDRVQKWA